MWLYEELQFSIALQYVTWVCYSLLFIMFATGFTHLVSPQAIGKLVAFLNSYLAELIDMAH